MFRNLKLRKPDLNPTSSNFEKAVMNSIKTEFLLRFFHLSQAILWSHI